TSAHHRSTGFGAPSSSSSRQPWLPAMGFLAKTPTANRSRPSHRPTSFTADPTAGVLHRRQIRSWQPPPVRSPLTSTTSVRHLLQPATSPPPHERACRTHHAHARFRRPPSAATPLLHHLLVASIITIQRPRSTHQQRRPLRPPCRRQQPIDGEQRPSSASNADSSEPISTPVMIQTATIFRPIQQSRGQAPPMSSIIRPHPKPWSTSQPSSTPSSRRQPTSTIPCVQRLSAHQQPRWPHDPTVHDFGPAAHVPLKWKQANRVRQR
ncbi:hypothetical protein ACLOJK_037867, partial [Asimina triloba]